MIGPRRGPGPARVSPAQIGPAQIGPAQIGPVQIGPVQIGPARIGPARVIQQEPVSAQMSAALRARADTRARVDVQVSVADGGSAAIPAGAEIYAAGRSGVFGVAGFRADERGAR